MLRTFVWRVKALLILPLRLGWLACLCVIFSSRAEVFSTMAVLIWSDLLRKDLAIVAVMSTSICCRRT